MECDAIWIEKHNNHVLQNHGRNILKWTNQFLIIFVDDVNIHNNDWNEHLEHLELVFERLRFVNIKLNL
jgi:hypothetical protein